MANTGLKTATQQVANVGYTKVYTSPSLTSPEWTERPTLFCNELNLRVAPGISDATLEYHFAAFTNHWNSRAAAVAPIDLNRQYVKIEVYTGEVDRGTSPKNKDDQPILDKRWIGVIEVDERNVDGDITYKDGVFKKAPLKNLTTGKSLYTAYGLEYEWEREVVSTSYVESGVASTDVLGKGLTFNETDNEPFSRFGNRTTGTFPASDPNQFSTVVFSSDKISVLGDTPFEWSAELAIRYLIGRYAPKDKNGTSITWHLVGETDAINWYKISAPTDRRSVRSIINSMVPRWRGVGWYLGTEEDGQTGEITGQINVFTFIDVPLRIPQDDNQVVTVSSNPNQTRLDFRNSWDVSAAEVLNASTHAVDEVVVEGQPITTTLSLTVANGDASDQMVRGWSDANETVYLDGASNTTGYAALTDNRKAQKNTLARSRDEMVDVFSRFELPDDWDMKTDAYNGSRFLTTIDATSLDKMSSSNLKQSFDSGGSASLDPFSLDRKTFLKYLPIRNDDNTEYLSPFCVFKIDDENEEYQFSDLLNANPEDAEQGRKFSASLRVLDRGMSVRLKVMGSGAQQLIAKERWTGAADTPEALDPNNVANHALNYSNGACEFTLSFEWDRRVSSSSGEETTDIAHGASLRKQFITVPDARLDIRLPGTIAGIKNDGTLQRDESGTLLRDDRNRLKVIAETAWKWYGTKRQALTLRYAGSTTTVGKAQQSNQRVKVDLGWLVTSIMAGQSDPDVRSPITAIKYVFPGDLDSEPSMEIQTSFAEVDFVT